MGHLFTTTGDNNVKIKGHYAYTVSNLFERKCWNGKVSALIYIMYKSLSQLTSAIWHSHHTALQHPLISQSSLSLSLVVDGTVTWNASGVPILETDIINVGGIVKTLPSWRNKIIYSLLMLPCSYPCREKCKLCGACNGYIYSDDYKNCHFGLDKTKCGGKG